MCSRVRIGVGIRGHGGGAFLEIIPNDPIPATAAMTNVLGQPPPQIALFIQHVAPLARFRPTEDVDPLTRWASSRPPIQKQSPPNEYSNDDQPHNDGLHHSSSGRGRLSSLRPR
jgi:hypothetical protein